MSTPDPRAAAREEVGTELRRVVRRWQQLPLDHALAASPRVREVVQRVADDVARETELPLTAVPDLGPAVLMDQLRVMVYDHGHVKLDPVPLAAALTALRRELS